MNLTTPPYSLSVVSNTVPAVFGTRGLGLGTGGAMRHCPRPSRVGDDAHGTAPLTPAAVTTPTGHMSGVTAANSHHPRYSPRLCVAATGAQVGAASTRLHIDAVCSRVAIAATLTAEARMRLKATKGDPMSRVSPLTARAALAMSDAKRRAMIAFMEDGELTAAEHEALRAIDEAGRLTELNDLARRCGNWIAETGNLEGVPVSPYLLRQVRELDAA